MRVEINTKNNGTIDGAIKQLLEYKQKLQSKERLFLKRLAEIGIREASIRFNSAEYDGNGNVVVGSEPTSTGWKVFANGQAVAFIEFGAGVAKGNGYQGQRPPEISNVGEYGKGKGKQQAWGFYDENGDLVITHGNRPAMGMYFAGKEMRANIERIAKEVFSA